MVEKKKKTGQKKPATKASRPPAKSKRKPRPPTPAKAAREASRPPEAAVPQRRAKPTKARSVPRPEPRMASGDSTPLGIHDLRPAFGATHSRKRVGRGPGSGHGKTAGRGSKGQKSRSGYRHMRGFEGGQMPLHRRVPKRGFTNIFRVEYDVVNLSALDRFESGAKVTPELLASHRLARGRRPVKILGDGQIGKPLEVSAHKFSAGAQAKIEAAGGRCEVIPR